ncbi:MAG: peptide MFS transporter [Saprospirales bacterium]|nr:peptide MFS transporter [Saprospirales bacterium]
MMHPAYKLMLIAWVAVAAWVAFVIFTNRKVHPRALFALFMVELWERFSYYGMRAILVLYMTSELINGGFAFDDAKAYGIYGAYGALVYLTPIIGGYFADKMMGFRKAILWGALLMAAGQFTLFMDNQTTFYIGLALLVVGNGFFKPNISSMIGRFYKDGDPRRDGAFTIFYMGINIGAFLTPLTCGAIGEIEGWRYGFLTAGVGMLLGYAIFQWAQRSKWYEEYGLVPEGANEVSFIGMNAKILPYVTTAVLIGIAWLLLKNDDIVDIMLAIVGSSVLAYLLYSSTKYEEVQKHRIWVIVILLLFTTVFWTFFELAGSALNLFTARNVNKNLSNGMELTTTFFQAVNPFFIMIFAPVYSWLWIKLAKADKEPAAPYKFATGLVLLGLGFLALNMGKSAAVAGLIPAFFLVALYLLHTLGELTLSPVGLSMVTKLAPAKIVAVLMGIWFLSSSIAHQAGKYIARFTAIQEANILKGDSFQSCMEDDVLKNAVKKEFFIDWLADNSKVKPGDSDPCQKYLTNGIDSVQYMLCHDPQSLEASLIHPQFIQYLNEQAGGRQTYQVGRFQYLEYKEKAEKIKDEKARKKALDESFHSFLTINSEYSDPGNIRIVPKMEAWTMLDQTSSGKLVACLRQDSLVLALSVFRKLGLFAIACGGLLFLLGPIIARWMHGIK